MTDHHAQTAEEGAFVIEAMLCSWSDSPAGRKVTFLLPDNGEDHPFKHLKAGTKYGQRLALSMALISDDETETPVVQPEAAQATPADENYSCDGEDVRAPAEPHAELREILADELEPARQRDQLERQQNVARPPMSPAQRAGMLTGDVRFQRFLREVYAPRWAQEAYDINGDVRPDKEIADRALKALTLAESKTEFNVAGHPADNWRALHGSFDLWCRS